MQLKLHLQQCGPQMTEVKVQNAQPKNMPLLWLTKSRARDGVYCAERSTFVTHFRIGFLRSLLQCASESQWFCGGGETNGIDVCVCV